MKFDLRGNKDFLAGLLFALTGGFAVALARGYVLGPLLEEYLRRAMLLARGDPTVFFTRPISLAFMVATALLLYWMIAAAARRRS